MSNLIDFSFEVSVPSALFLNTNIDDRSMRLFMVIKGLTRAHGYCYATNAYLAKTLKTSEPTVKRCLIQLKNEGFIEIQTDKTGIHWQRRIFLGNGLKKFLRRITDDLPPDHGRSPPSSQMIHNNIVLNNTVLKEETPPTPKGELQFFGNFVQLTKEDVSVLHDQFGREAVLEVIDEINDYLASTGKKPYKDYAATIRNWMRRRKQSGSGLKSNIEQNKELTQKVIKHYVKEAENGIIRDSVNGIEFTYGNFYLMIRYDDKGFRSQVESQLRKMNFVIETLW